MFVARQKGFVPNGRVTIRITSGASKTLFRLKPVLSRKIPAAFGVTPGVCRAIATEITGSQGSMPSRRSALELLEHGL